MRCVGLPVFGFGLLLSSCFDLQRTRDLGEGNITLRVVDDEGNPVPGAVVSLDGLARLSTSDASGLVKIQAVPPGDQVLRVLVDDADDVDDPVDDGVAERAAIVTTSGVARVDFSSGAFTAAVSKLTTDVLGDVVVVATGSVSGSVAGCDVDLCRMLVFREMSLGAVDPRQVAGVVEASVGVGADGTFLVAGIAAGPIKVVAFSWPRPDSTLPFQQMIAASRDISSFGVVDVVIVSGAAALAPALVLAAVPTSVAAFLEIGGEPDDLALLEREVGRANFLVPHIFVEVDSDLVGEIRAAVSAVDVPVGVFDVSVEFGGSAGLMRRALAVPGVARLGPIAMGPVVPCRQVGEKDDCDGDGVNVDNDEDDDGDGQADSDEAAGCRGPGLGTDYDHDCLCEPADPYPRCQSNDPLDCALLEAPVCDP